MPAYQATPPPPQSLAPGDIGYSFGSVNSHQTKNLSGNYPGVIVVDSPTITETAEIIPAAGSAGAQFALTRSVPSGESGGRAITYEAEFDSAPTTASVSLQGAMRDVDAEYVTLDSQAAITTVRGSKTVTGVRQLFLRLRLDSITPNAATKIIGKILG